MTPPFRSFLTDTADEAQARQAALREASDSEFDCESQRRFLGVEATPVSSDQAIALLTALDLVTILESGRVPDETEVARARALLETAMGVHNPNPPRRAA